MEIREFPLANPNFPPRTLKLTESWIDFPDNDSLAVCVCFAGCQNSCLGCQSPELQDYRHPDCVLWDNLRTMRDEIARHCLRNHTNKVVFSGGDPLASFNRDNARALLDMLYDKYDVCVYTGFSIDEVKKMGLRFKFVKCGKFDLKSKRKSFKTDDVFCLASPNQNFYDSNYDLISKDGILCFENTMERILK
ncbi:MAG: radical SAM protein [Elusimicrobiota bacterium]|nr:radical SAM protein [Elusimicrobiota bacterium]